MKKTIVAIAVLMTIVKTGASYAQMVREGTHEVGGAGSMSVVHAEGATTFNFQAAYGYFLKHYFVPGILMQFAFGNSSDYEEFMPTVTFYYNEGQRVLPFFVLGAGVATAETKGTEREVVLAVSPGIGVLVPLNENVALKTSFFYSRGFPIDSNRPDDEPTNSFFVTPIGLSVLF